MINLGVELDKRKNINSFGIDERETEATTENPSRDVPAQDESNLPRTK